MTSSSAAGALPLGYQQDGLDTVGLWQIDPLYGPGLLYRYVPGAGTDEPVAEYYVPQNRREFLHADERGSIVTISDDNGAMTAWNRYGEFGEAQAGNYGLYGYTGQLSLLYTGLPELTYYKARMYHPKLGRFLQTDPVGYGPSPNLYAYVGNDPVNMTDPLGLQAEGGNDDVIVVTALRVALFGSGGAVFVGGGLGSGNYSAYVEQLLEQQRQEQEFEDACAADPNCAGQEIVVTGTKLAENKLLKLLRMGPFKALDFVWHSPAGETDSSIVHPIQFAPDRARLRHIFSGKTGHYAKDTPANRANILSVVTNKNYVGTTRFGVQYFARLNPDGTQTWAEVRNGFIWNGGLNQTPVYGHPQIPGH